MKTALQGTPLAVRGGKKLPGAGIERILIRGTNWIGDVVMTLPALAAIRKTWPGARISVLAKPWVSEIYRLSPDVDEIIVFQEPGRHAGVMGKLRLAGELRKKSVRLRHPSPECDRGGDPRPAGRHSASRRLQLRRPGSASHPFGPADQGGPSDSPDRLLSRNGQGARMHAGGTERSTAPRKRLRWRGGKAVASNTVSRQDDP